MKRERHYSLGPWLLWAVILPLVLIAVGAGLVISTDAANLPFDNAHLWWITFAVPAAGLLCLFGAWRRRRALRRFASPTLSGLLVSGLSTGRQALRAGLVVMALVLISAAIIGPRWGLHLEERTVYGVDIAVVLDVSRSMLAKDVAPNRLEYAKEQIRQQLTEREIFQRANRLAMMAFAGSSSLRLPLTTDHLAFRRKLEEINVGDVPRGGTAIGSALQDAIDLFSRSPETATRIIFLFTDGEDHEGQLIEVAQLAEQEHGIRVYTIGVGDSSLSAGAPVPRNASPDAKPLLHEGQIVYSKLDVDGLRRIAEAGGGRYADISDLYRLVDHVAAMRVDELGTEERMRHRPRYQWFLAAALILLAVEIMMSSRRSTGSDEPRRVWQLETT